ncbi:MAG TPA: metal ABC transporter ATP-binding protein [Steroidobacteraceae bacterium]|nr:metal ABC transporter ATP-binding protein [Steroidobacteraceae bacterium]
MTEPVLQVGNLGVRLGAQEVLRHLDFSLARGQSLAVIGPNGSGKTVLLRALIGALPHTGSIRWAAGTRLGYLPQKLDLERDLPVSGADLLHARAALAGVGRADIAAAVAAIGLDEAALVRPVGTLAGGQFQRLLIAGALLSRPNVLLLDEPAAGIDAPGQERLNELIHRLQLEDGMTTVMVSHDLSVVYRYADQVLCLGRERTCFGPARTALTPELLQDIYGAPIALHVHDGSAHEHA